MSDLEKLLSITISFEMCEKTPVVEHFNTSLRQLARVDFKSLHQQRARGDKTIWSLHKLRAQNQLVIDYTRSS